MAKGRPRPVVRDDSLAPAAEARRSGVRTGNPPSSPPPETKGEIYVSIISYNIQSSIKTRLLLFVFVIIRIMIVNKAKFTTALD